MLRLVTPEDIKQGTVVWFCYTQGKTQEIQATVVQDYEEGDQEAIIFWEHGEENDMIPLSLTHLYVKEEE